ncbi:MAK10-like protein [Tanacetum coccineum]
MGHENPIRTLGDYSKPSHEGYRNTIELLVGNNVVPLQSDTIWLVQNGCSFYGLHSEDPNQQLKDFLKLVDSLDLDGENSERTRLCLFQFSLRDQASIWLERLPAGSNTTWEDLTTRFLAQFFPPRRTAKLHNDILIRTIDQSAGGKLRDLNAEESWTLLEDLTLYDNKSWNDPRDFAKPVKAITLPQDVPSTSDRCLIELENQVQRLMEAYLASTQPTQVNKITTSCEICSGPHDTQYCMDDSEQAYVDYAFSRVKEMGGKKFTLNQGPRNFNGAANTSKEKPNFNWAHSQTFTSPQNESISVHSSSHQMKLEKALLDFDSNQEKSKDSDTEEDVSTTNARRRDLGKMTRGNEEVKEQGKEEDEMETNVEVKEVIEEEDSEFETDKEVEEILKEEEEDKDNENFNSFPTMKELSHHEWQDEENRRGIRHLMRLEKEMD